MTEETRVIKIFESFILGVCKCGCNEDIPIRSKSRKLQKYQFGHRCRLQTGELAANYKGGERKFGPYKGILRSDHPNAMKDGYVLNHRLVYEHYLKILFDEDVYIPLSHDIHHIIPVKEGGTDALINLEVKTKKEHVRYHHIKDMTGIICSICGSDKTSMIKLGDLIRPHWLGSKEKGFKCTKCYDKDPIIKERATQRRHERMKDPIYRQKNREYQREYYKRKRKRLKINILDQYSG